jgi:hypothetical protein
VEFNDGKDPLRPSYKGKQFAVSAPKLGKTNDVFFEKKHLWIAEVGGGYRLLAASSHVFEYRYNGYRQQPRAAFIALHPSKQTAMDGF